MNALLPHEDLEAYVVPNSIIKDLNLKIVDGEIAGRLDFFLIEKVIGKGGFSKVM